MTAKQAPDGIGTRLIVTPLPENKTFAEAEHLPSNEGNALENVLLSIAPNFAFLKLSVFNLKMPTNVNGKVLSFRFNITSDY